MDPQLAPALEALGRWARRRHGSPVQVTVRRRTALRGGFVARAVTRLDLDLSSATGARERISVVLKRVGGPEAGALRALQAMPRRPPELPELLGEGRDEAGPWVLMPFFPGRAPEGPIPHSVFRALADLHVAFAGGDVDLQALTPVDPDGWRDLCLTFVLRGVDEARDAAWHPLLDRARDSLVTWADDARLAEALGILPRTLVHGDMHAGNIVVAPDGAAIVDWGNARTGPAMLDLANITEMGSPHLRTYLDRCAELTGIAVDPRLARIGFLWATVYVNTAYLAFAVRRDFLGIDGVESLPPRHLQRMLDRAENALERLGQEL